MDDKATTRDSTTDGNRFTFSVHRSLTQQEKAQSSLHVMFDALASYIRTDTSFDSVRDVEFVEDQHINDNDDSLFFDGDHTSIAHNSKLPSVNYKLVDELKGERKSSNKLQAKHLRYLSAPSGDIMVMNKQWNGEETPLLTNKNRIGRRTKSLFYGKGEGDGRNIAPVVFLSEAQKDRLVRLSAAFLMDYERSRPATLHGNIDELTDRHLQLRALRFSKSWCLATVVSAICLFVVPYFEQTIAEEWNRYIIFIIFTLIPTIVFFVDMEINRYLQNETSQDQLSKRNIGPRGEKQRVDFYLSISLGIICIESAMELVRKQQGIVWSRVFTPIALFYVFHEARDSLSAFRQVIPQLVGILAAQLSAELFFAAAALLFFGSQYTDKFGTLQLSFINLYQCEYCQGLC
jgi:hypothetical protein